VILSNTVKSAFSPTNDADDMMADLRRERQKEDNLK
jgi:hypothetical protein